MSEEYKRNLVEVLGDLRSFHSTILGSVINLAMEGEFKEWNDTTLLDTEITFEIDFFKDSEDANVLHLVELGKKVEEIYSRIASENDICED